MNAYRQGTARMNGEHNTLVGTPVVVAPGRICLVGEYDVLEEGISVVVAVTRRAVAQYIPRGEPTSAFVAQIVDFAKDGLGEAASALPPGSVLVETEAFGSAEDELFFGADAAIAVAAVGAVFEAAGQSLDEHKAKILAIAAAACRAVAKGGGSSADVTAATHGGLVRIVGRSGHTPLVEPLPTPSGLSLVLFATAEAVSQGDLVDGVRRFAVRDPVAYHEVMHRLHEIAECFSSELAGGDAVRAVAAAGQYGRQLAMLGAVALLPIVTQAFLQASELAEKLGGFALPLRSSHADSGVALFATAEAARLFERFCQKPVCPLAGDLALVGVRLRPAEEAVAQNTSSTSLPQTLDADQDSGQESEASKWEQTLADSAPVNLRPTFSQDFLRFVRRPVVLGVAAALLLGIGLWGLETALHRSSSPLATGLPMRASSKATIPSPPSPASLSPAKPKEPLPMPSALTALPAPIAGSADESPAPAKASAKNARPVHHGAGSDHPALTAKARSPRTSLAKAPPPPASVRVLAPGKTHSPRAGDLTLDDFK